MKVMERRSACTISAPSCAKRSVRLGALAATLAKGLFLGLLAIGIIPCPTASADNAAQSSISSRPVSAQKVLASSAAIETKPAAAHVRRRADFKGEDKSPNAQHVADWVVDSGDNTGMSFVIVDKVDAKVFVFDANGQLRGAARCLLGLTKGDDPVSGTGGSHSPKHQDLTTPAGRFMASLGMNMSGKDVLWVDYETAVSLHRVITNKPEERRLQRLSTASALDKRISHGCINVPAKFFDSVVSPVFNGVYGLVYVLPETRPIKQTFASYYEID